MLWVVGFVGSVAAAMYHGTLIQNWKTIGLFCVLIPAVYVLAYWYHMRFPIIALEHGTLKLQVWWEKWQIEVASIKQIKKQRGFAAYPILKGLLHFTRPYWRIEIHYLKRGEEKQLDIDLTQFRKSETEELLGALKRVRADLDVPSLDRRGF
jgi:hypothetical protein